MEKKVDFLKEWVKVQHEKEKLAKLHCNERAAHWFDWHAHKLERKEHMIEWYEKFPKKKEHKFEKKADKIK
jgi:hypothetical protein